MGLYQPTVITPSQLNGTGVIDATQDMTVTWQINGTSPVYEWQYIIMQNDADSTVVYTSDWLYNTVRVFNPVSQEYENIQVYTPGRDPGGNPIPITNTISAASLASAGIVNWYANGYKLRINQKYRITEGNTIVYNTLVQINPAFFITESFPEIDTSSWENTTGRYRFFSLDLYENGSLLGSLQRDPVVYKRQRLAYANDPDDNIIKDSGNIYMPCDQNPLVHYNSELVYGILKNHTEYAFRMNVELESGVKLDSGWINFSTSWTDTALDYVHLRAYYVKDQPAMFIRLEVDDGYDESILTDLPDYQRWTIYRVRVDNGDMEKVGIIPKGQCAMYDFGVKNNTEYKYRAYYGLGSQDGYMYETENTIKMRHYWNWAIIETEKVDSLGYYLAGHSYKNPMYHVVRVHQFQGNVDSGSVSNENSPYVENNFTPYPTVQKVARKGMSGKLQAWVGMVKNAQFSDSVKMVDQITDMSTRNTVKFLRDRKGNLRMIEISEPIVKTTQDKYAEQPVAVEIPWVEVGDAKECQIVSMLTDGIMATGDDIIDTATTISVDDDGYVVWAYNDENYVGSSIGMNDSGGLVQTYDNGMNYVPADLTIDNDGKLKAESVVDEDNG